VPSSRAVRWFYVDKGRRYGPVTLDELLDRLLNNHLTSETPVWHAGLTGWVQAHTVPEIAAELPPPLPGAAVPAAPEVPPEMNPEVAEVPGPLPEMAAPPSRVVEAVERRHRHHRIGAHRSTARWDLVLLVIAMVVLVLVLWRMFRQGDTIPSGIIGLGQVTPATLLRATAIKARSLA
jgi:hypothetical protein